jgi:hypothetical protein
MLVTPGRIIKLSSITDEEGKGWAEAFQKLLNLKYTQEELAEKDQIRKVMCLICSYLFLFFSSFECFHISRNGNW